MKLSMSPQRRRTKFVPVLDFLLWLTKIGKTTEPVPAPALKLQVSARIGGGRLAAGHPS